MHQLQIDLSDLRSDVAEFVGSTAKPRGTLTTVGSAYILKGCLWNTGVLRQVHQRCTL